MTPYIYVYLIAFLRFILCSFKVSATFPDPSYGSPFIAISKVCSFGVTTLLCSQLYRMMPMQLPALAPSSHCSTPKNLALICVYCGRCKNKWATLSRSLLRLCVEFAHFFKLWLNSFLFFSFQAYMPADNNTVAVGFQAGMIKLMNVNNKAPPTVLAGHTGRINCLQFADRFLVSSADDGYVASFK